jgi:DNA-binding IclR family transcriptional regulator
MTTENSHILHHAVKILDCFSQEQPELGVREVARMADLSSSAAGRLMLSMKGLGILNQNPKTKTYSLGSRVLTWAGVYLTNSDIRITALPYLQELHQSTQETISLYILESPQNVRIIARLGRRLPLYAGSAGKVFLAFMKPEQCERILTDTPLVPLTSKTIVDLDALQLELEKIRFEGYAVSRGEWLLDASGVAAPIYDATGENIAVLTISGPSQRFTDEVIARYAQLVTQQALQISLSLGYRQTHQAQPIQPPVRG